jgi:hypothetical protein
MKRGIVSNPEIVALHFLAGVQAQVNISSHFTPLEATFWLFCVPFETESQKSVKRSLVVSRSNETMP